MIFAFGNAAPDQRRIEEVQRHLVDEPLACAPCAAACCRRRPRRRPRGRSARRPPASRHRARGSTASRVARFSTSPKFVSSPAEKTLRVARQDPLDERRARARHADDEDRLARRVTVAARGLRAPRASVPPPRTELRSAREVVAERRGLAALAALEQAKRRCVAAFVLVLLRERMTEMQLGIGVERRVLERALERRDFARPSAARARLARATTKRDGSAGRDAAPGGTRLRRR